MLTVKYSLLVLLPSYHVDLNMDTIVTSITDLFSMVTQRKPKFKVHGGTTVENMALQNIQVRKLQLCYDLAIGE